jgi:hypothetical protein
VHSLANEMPSPMEPSLDCWHGDSQQGGDLLLAESTVPVEAECFPILGGESIDRFVELGPDFQSGGSIFTVGSILECAMAVIGGTSMSVGVVVGSVALGSEVMPEQINEGTADLSCRQPKELPNRLGSDFTQRSVEPYNGGLEHVIALLPTLEVRVVAEHPPCQSEEPFRRLGNQLAVSVVVSRRCEVEESLKLSRVPFGLHEIGHRFAKTHCQVESYRLQDWQCRVG